MNEILGLNLLDGDSVAALRALSDKFNAHKFKPHIAKVVPSYTDQVNFHRPQKNASNLDHIPTWGRWQNFWSSDAEL